jgi:tRNA (mo5U34)-methyltransferase
MDLEKLRSRVDKIQWFHDFELVPGVMTDGWTPMAERLPYYQIPQDLGGKRVLDIGCADGYFTFLAESRGANVVAIDSWPREGFFLAHEVLNSRAEFYHMSVYDLCPDTFGLFDIVFFFGVYYHLKSPLSALERIACVTREYAIVESEVVDFQCAEGNAFSRFYEFDELNNDPSNWWGPNIACLLQTTRAAGFPRVELVSYRDNTRAVVRAYKGPRTVGKPLTENIFIAVDTPTTNVQVEGIVLVSGWALHQLEPQDGIEHVTVYLNNLDDPDSVLGEAEYKIHREDLTPSLSPIYGDVGFQFAWHTTGVPPGEHILYVLVEGRETWNYALIPITIGVPERKQDTLDTEVLGGLVEQEHGHAHEDIITELNRMVAECEAEIARLRELVAGYEKGRFIRFMRWLHNLCPRRTDG